MASLYNGYTAQMNYFARKAHLCILKGDIIGFKRNAKIVHTIMELRNAIGRPVR